MILARLQLWLRRRRPVEKFTSKDWALIEEAITQKLEREHLIEVQHIRTEEAGRFQKLLLVLKLRPGPTVH
jgi:hypothetical protein